MSVSFVTGLSSTRSVRVCMRMCSVQNAPSECTARMPNSFDVEQVRHDFISQRRHNRLQPVVAVQTGNCFIGVTIGIACEVRYMTDSCILIPEGGSSAPLAIWGTSGALVQALAEGVRREILSMAAYDKNVHNACSSQVVGMLVLVCLCDTAGFV